jgi:hypothetical protein
MGEAVGLVEDDATELAACIQMWAEVTGARCCGRKSITTRAALKDPRCCS